MSLPGSNDCRCCCPYCEQEMATIDEEVAHMQEAHPEVIAERLRAAGFMLDEATGEWIDMLT